MVSFTPDILRWHLYQSPERLQVLLCILLHTDDAGIIDPCVVQRLPVLTGLSSITISRSLADLVADGILECATYEPNGAFGIRLLRLPDGIALGSAVEVVAPAAKEEQRVDATTAPAEPVPDAPSKKPAKRRTRAPFRKPTLEEVAAYINEQGYSVDPQYFMDYEETVGWVVGKTRKPMKDWKAAIRLQERTNSKPITHNPKLSSYEQQRQSSRDLYLAAEAGVYVQGAHAATVLGTDDGSLAKALEYIPADGIN